MNALTQDYRALAAITELAVERTVHGAMEAGTVPGSIQTTYREKRRDTFLDFKADAVTVDLAEGNRTSARVVLVGITEAFTTRVNRRQFFKTTIELQLPLVVDGDEVDPGESAGDNLALHHVGSTARREQDGERGEDD